MVTCVWGGGGVKSSFTPSKMGWEFFLAMLKWRGHNSFGVVLTREI